MSAAIDRSETQELITDFRHGAPAKPLIVESGQHRTTVLTAKSLHRPVYLFQANKTRSTAHCACSSFRTIIVFLRLNSECLNVTSSAQANRELEQMQV